MVSFRFILGEIVEGVKSVYTLLKYVIRISNLFNRTKKETKADQTSETHISEHESVIADLLVNPESMDVTWTDIAGHSDVIEEIKATVLLPLRESSLSSKSKLLQPPKGVLLHGPPGCGKTLLAKAIAKEAGAKFINMEVSTLTNVHYGESQKTAAAVFTYARKIQPCIIFIDEIDSFLRSRNIDDNETTAMVKGQFLTLWDGLLSGDDCQVIVMEATNRPQDVDEAVLRRMPAKFYIGPPTRDDRVEILNLVLRKEIIGKGIDVNLIANMAEGFSGSDLKEICRGASLVRFRDSYSKGFSKAEKLRCITMDDFTTTIDKMKESKRLITTDHSIIGLTVEQVLQYLYDIFIGIYNRFTLPILCLVVVIVVNFYMKL